MSATSERGLPSRHIVIAGDGLAAWMAAAALSRTVRLQDWSIKVVGVPAASRDFCACCPADATLPFSAGPHFALELDEDRLVEEAGSVFTYGIAVGGWSQPDATYFHPFGPPGASLGPVGFHQVALRLRNEGVRLRLANYSLPALAAQAGRFSRPGVDSRSVLSTCQYGVHVECARLSKLLRSDAKGHGVESLTGGIREAELANDGTLAAIVTTEGTRIEGDLFLDCTGTDALLMQKLGNTQWEDWSAWLPCDRFVAARILEQHAPPPYSMALANGGGWLRELPVHGGRWLTAMHCVAHWNSEKALGALRQYAGAGELEDLREGAVGFGRRTRAWQGNCVALGAAAVHIDPLALSNLQLLRLSIDRLLRLLPAQRAGGMEAREFNRLTALQQDHARDFAILHYKLNGRYGEPLWDSCRRMQLPETLEYKLRSYESRGRVAMYDEEPLDESSWLNLMDEHGVRPRRYAPMVEGFGVAELNSHVDRVRKIMIGELAGMPLHRDYLAALRGSVHRTGNAK